VDRELGAGVEVHIALDGLLFGKGIVPVEAHNPTFVPDPVVHPDEHPSEIFDKRELEVEDHSTNDGVSSVLVPVRRIVIEFSIQEAQPYGFEAFIGIQKQDDESSVDKLHRENIVFDKSGGGAHSGEAHLADLCHQFDPEEVVDDNDGVGDHSTEPRLVDLLVIVPLVADFAFLDFGRVLVGLRGEEISGFGPGSVLLCTEALQGSDHLNRSLVALFRVIEVLMLLIGPLLIASPVLRLQESTLGAERVF
jgi:hypothetical protein